VKKIEMMSKKTFLYGFGAIVIWSTTFSTSKFVLEITDTLNFNVFTYLALRLVFAVPYLWGVLLITKRIHNVKTIIKEQWKILLFLGLIAFAASYIVQYFGVLWTTSINQGIFLQFQTFFVFFMSAIIYKNKINPFIYLGAVVAFSGLFFIITNSSGSETFSINMDTIWGDLMSLATALLWGSFSAVSAEIVKKYDRLTVLTLVVSISSFAIVPFAFMDLGPGFSKELAVLSWLDWLMLVWLGIVAIGIGYHLWYEALADSPSQETIILMYIMPIFSYFFGWVILGETVSFWKTLIGTVLIIGGLAIAQFLYPKKWKVESPLQTKEDESEKKSHNVDIPKP
jgi:drug/metabolite transporter (DMT)-like permease